jgi:hypothetical protein
VPSKIQKTGSRCVVAPIVSTPRAINTQITLWVTVSSGRAMPKWGPRKLAAPPTTMTTIMLRHTQRTTRPSVFAGRVRRTDITVAPGMTRMVTTPGNGVIGEWIAPSMTDDTSAAHIQIAVGITRDPNSLSTDQYLAGGWPEASLTTRSLVLEPLVVTTSRWGLSRIC